MVLFQFPIIGFAERYARRTMLALGATLYAVGFGLVGFVSTAALFALADVAPEDMRGRYMGASGLAWGTVWSSGPLLASLVMDRANPHYVWYCCLAAAVAFLWSGRWRAAEGWLIHVLDRLSPG